MRNGVWLGLLSAAQLFTGEELLAQTATAGLVLVIALAASRPQAVRARAHGAAWPSSSPRSRFWRDSRVRAAAVTWAVLEVLGLGAEGQTFLGVHFPGGLLPWHWLQGLPVLGEILPDRFALLADGAAAAVFAFSLDLARSAAPTAAGWRWRSLPFAVAALALLPLIPGRAGRHRVLRPGESQSLGHVPGRAVGPITAAPCPIQRADPRRSYVPAACRRRSGHQPGLASGALPDRAFRSAHPAGWPHARVAADEANLVTGSAWRLPPRAQSRPKPAYRRLFPSPGSRPGPTAC